jgi:hypothetical protein
MIIILNKKNIMKQRISVFLPIVAQIMEPETIQKNGASLKSHKSKGNNKYFRK